MTKAEMLTLIHQNPAFCLATCEDGQPRARMLMTYRADERGIVFMTGTQKDVNRQLLKNPRAELCYFDPTEKRQLRVTGTLTTLEDNGLKEQIIEKFAFLKPVAEQFGLGAFTVWCMPGGSAVLWDAKNPLAPKEPTPF